MNFIELSVSETKQQTIELAKKMEQHISPDIIVFIAKGAYMIGYEMANYFDVPVVEIFAKRKGNRMKEVLSPLLFLLPTKLKVALRKKELRSMLHTKNTTRDVSITSGQHFLSLAKNIVIVDDSVDTGATMNEVFEFVREFSPQANIKMAALNVFEKSKNRIQIADCCYENTILIGPWSKDSMYYTSFLKEYEQLKRIGAF